MTAFLPTTRVAIARPGAAVDEWDDATGAATTVASGVPASIVETFQRTYDGTEGRGGVVETVTVRLRPGTDVREGDQLTATDGRVYQVDAVSTPPPFAGLADVRLAAHRTGSSSTT